MVIHTKTYSEALQMEKRLSLGGFNHRQYQCRKDAAPKLTELHFEININTAVKDGLQMAR